MTKSIKDTLRLNNAINKARALEASESMRREMIESGQPQVDLRRADQRWDTAELQQYFTVHSFLAPFVVVTRKSDGVKGTMEFTHSPRWYFNFTPDEG